MSGSQTVVGPRAVWQGCGGVFKSKDLDYFACFPCSVTDWSTPSGTWPWGRLPSEYQNAVTGDLGQLCHLSLENCEAHSHGHLHFPGLLYQITTNWETWNKRHLSSSQEMRSPKSICWQGWFFLEALREKPCFSPGFLWLPAAFAFLGL